MRVGPAGSAGAGGSDQRRERVRQCASLWEQACAHAHRPVQSFCGIICIL